MTARWSGRQSRRCIPRRLLALPCSNWESYLCQHSLQLTATCLFEIARHRSRGAARQPKTRSSQPRRGLHRLWPRPVAPRA